MAKQRFAIIGGGISGLSAAWYLMKHDLAAKITVFESKATLGGNAFSPTVRLGQDYRQYPDAPVFHDRVADLGVNDINILSYNRLREVMAETGYYTYNSAEPDTDRLRRLEDSICFFTPDGRETYTVDTWLQEGPTRGIVDERFSTTSGAHERALKGAEHRFMALAAKDYDPCNSNEAWWNESVREYVEKFMARHGQEVGFDQVMLDRVARVFLYPRVAAMYFADERGPYDMPFRGVMSYYRLQEGYTSDGDTQADRLYFVNGSQSWIEYFADYLTSVTDAAGDQITTIRRSQKAFLQRKADGGLRAVVAGQEGASGVYLEDVDQVIMACHADHALEALMEGDQHLIENSLVRAIGQIRHAESRAVAHTWTGVLPPDISAWRSYNVAIRDGEALLPYSMTYVQNRHSNDAADLNFRDRRAPTFFVTLNPQTRIPDQHVLRIAPAERNGVFAAPGYGRDRDDGDKAVTFFRHIVLDANLMNTQRVFDLYHASGAHKDIWFAGCWTRGAGLHEECFEQAETIAKAIGAQAPR